ncbi:hypothetical protein [Bradyrhizobium oropedii]|uniref:hypothetical protein n=1 Tax=Bradyrhizobium oropedii TaxID=1571201 RepID=UPI001E631123|nr:hypothetical protein [Bradyrhizobium oropedii]
MAVTDAYCAATGLSTSRVSTLIFNDGKRLDAIREGKDLYTSRFEHAMQWFSDRWPDDGKSWPLGVPRPAPTPAQSAHQPEAAQ